MADIQSEDAEAASPPADPNRLRNHFRGYEGSAKRWDELWIDGSYLPWDRGGASTALADALSDRRDLFGSPLKLDGQRKKAFVPGCGKGYDVLLLASFGYDVWGLEGSETAIREAKKVQQIHGSDYEARDTAIGRGTVTYVHGDFFDEDWMQSIPDAARSGFDIIYDYTFLRALPPALRPKWALRMSQLLNDPSGHLICLEFPTNKNPADGGPPWALYSAVYLQLLPRPGEEPKYKDDGFIIEDNPEPNERGFVRVAHWKPERTHKAGEGNDWMSIWGRRNPKQHN